AAGVEGQSGQDHVVRALDDQAPAGEFGALLGSDEGGVGGYLHVAVEVDVADQFDDDGAVGLQVPGEFVGVRGGHGVGVPAAGPGSFLGRPARLVLFLLFLLPAVGGELGDPADGYFGLFLLGWAGLVGLALLGGGVGISFGACGRFGG